GITSFNGPVGTDVPLSSILTAPGGTATINTHSIQTTGNQSFGAVTLAADATLSAGNSGIFFGGKIDGGLGLTVNAGSTLFNLAVGSTTPLANLTINAPSNQVFANSITTVVAQTYTGSLFLNNTLTLASTSNGDITFASSIDATSTNPPA